MYVYMNTHVKVTFIHILNIMPHTWMQIYITEVGSLDPTLEFARKASEANTFQSAEVAGPPPQFQRDASSENAIK